MPETDYSWIKIRSWHAVSTPTRVPNQYKTVCNKTASGEVVDDLPGTEKSCESCLRIIARNEEKARKANAISGDIVAPEAPPATDVGGGTSNGVPITAGLNFPTPGTDA